VQDSSESVEVVYLRFRKIVVERVTVVKFRVDNRGSNGTGRFRIEVRTDAAELHHECRLRLHIMLYVEWYLND